MKLKSVFFSIFFLMGSTVMMADVVDVARARAAARQFMQTQTRIQAVGEDALELAYTAVDVQQRPLLYAFNAGANAFVIVSAEDVLSPILAYSYTSRFDAQHVPPAMAEWMRSCESQVSSVRERAECAADPMWKMLEDGVCTIQSVQEVQPLVSTRWGQDGFKTKTQFCNNYNLFCPYDAVAEKYALTGCVATAMAQIMKHWAYPKTGAGDHRYRHAKYGELYVNFEKGNYVYDSMPDVYDCSSSDGQNNAVSLLMYHCGVSVNMDYGVDASGSTVSGLQSQTAESAFRRYFGYPEATAVKRANYSDAEWLKLMKKELDAGRPMLYSGSSRTSGGHAFVCDGYDANNMLHFNWGWNGSMDGYFAVTALKPGTLNFTDEQTAVIGIQPPKAALQPDANNILYVAEKGCGKEDGSSWENATSHLLYALNRASVNPLQVWVKAGHYVGNGKDTNAFIVSANVSMYGGFEGTEGGNYDLSLRDWEKNATVLDGQHSQRVLLLREETDGQKARCDGFIIRNGVVKAAFTDGGGVYLKPGSILSNCHIDSCTAEHAYASGGGVAVDAAEVISCRISHCSALNGQSGGGLSMPVKSRNSRVVNTLIDHNKAPYGGGAVMWGGGEFINCNFIANTATKGGSALYSNAYQETTRVVNCIFWKNRMNTYAFNQLAIGQTNADIRYCAMEKNGYSGGQHMLVLDSNNEGSREGMAYPFFADPAAGDYHLLPTSSCIDAGTDGVQLPVTDAEGNRRVFKASANGIVDLGMYEFSREYEKEYNYYDTLCQGRLYRNYGFDVETHGAGDTLCFREDRDTLYKLHLYVQPRRVVEMTAFISPKKPTYTWEDSTYSKRGDYKRMFVAANGCDSIRILHLLDNEGVEGYSVAQAVKAYPNPASSEVCISIEEGVLSLVDHLVLCDVHGRVLYRSNRLETLNRIDMSEWAAGMYFAALYGEGRLQHTLKLIKQ